MASLAPAILACLLAISMACAAAQQLTLPPGYQQINVTSRVPLPSLPLLQYNVSLNMTATEFQGPGDNSTDSKDPYVLFTGRMYNDAIVPGVIRVKQGETVRLRVCNQLAGTIDNINGSTNVYGYLLYPSDTEGTNGFKDPNILANHLHGFMGNPGTNTVPCSPLPADGTPCYRGDNIFEDIVPGQCREYQYDIPVEHPAGMLWIHPHHHGSSSLQSAIGSVPVVVDHSPGVGFDFLGSPSCQAYAAMMANGSTEVIMHMQTIMAHIDPADGDVPAAPTDDAMIAISQKILPQDPYCCSGPSAENTEEEAPVLSEFPFYTSGENAQFTLINGVYQPNISMQAGVVYRWKMVQASTMQWMDLSFDQPGCTFGLYSRDAVFLRSLPRMSDHIMMGPANRVEAFVSCEPGTYQLRTGLGPLQQQESCQSTHCELLVQDVLATLEVAPAPAGASASVAQLPTCNPNFPETLLDYRDGSPTLKAVSASHYGLLNFTNPADTPNSAGCAVNGLLYQDSAPMQEVIGDLMELNLENVDLHPYHHHIQPMQLVALPDSDPAKADNGTWLIGDYVDTLLLPETGTQARVRWVPGPANVTGTGYAVLHCHILPHEDEGCMMKTQLLDNTYVHVAQHGLSKGGASVVTLICIAVVLGGIAALIVLKRRRKARQWQRQRAATALMPGRQSPVGSTGSSGADSTVKPPMV